jgi:hypothetical protein
VKDLTVNFIHPKGQLENGMNDILIEFRDTASGDLVDVGAVKFDLDMNMPGMVMHSGSTIEPTATPGQYRAKVKPDMAGDWMATLHYEGPRGVGDVSFLGPRDYSMRVWLDPEQLASRNMNAGEVLKALREKYGVKEPGDVIAPVGTANAYDGLYLVALAIDQAGSTDGAKVRDALENLVEVESGSRGLRNFK